MDKIEKLFFEQAEKLECRKALFDTTLEQLNKMKQHHPATYYHEMRVALIAARIAEFCGHKDIKPEFYGGANHDTGKLGVNMQEYDAREITTSEFKKIKKHTNKGHLALKDYFFTSVIAGAHHKHQKNSYGINPAKIIRKTTLSDINKTRLEEAIINVSLADYYDACSTRNTKLVTKGERCQNIEENYPNQKDKVEFLKNDNVIREILGSY